MSLQNMKYKDYEWTHNPSKIKITNAKTIKELLIPFKQNILQDFGRGKRIVTGDGELIGENCIQQFNELYSVFKQQGLGYLSLPNTQAFLATFRSLQMLGEAKSGLISYSFEFWEEVHDHDINKKSRPENFCITLEGETLWDIAIKYNTTVDKLLKLNVNIKSPDRINEGRKVILP